MSRGSIVACCAIFALATGAARASTLVVCSEASPDALNAALSDANVSFDISEQIADRLVEMKPGGSEVIPGLAQSWTISPDGLHYTFRLRHGVKFQSNSQFKPSRDMNADDVVFSFNRMADKSNSYHDVDGASYPMFSDFIAPALKSVRKASDDTVAFDLNTPSASLLSALTVQSFSIWSAEYAAAMERAGEAEIAMNGGTWDYPDPDELTATQTCDTIADGSNVSHWCNKAYSDLIRKADVVTDQAARARLYEQAQVVFHDEVPSMMFADVRGFVGARDSVEGFRLHFLGGQDAYREFLDY